MNKQHPTTIKLEDYSAPNFKITHVDLDFDLYAESTTVNSKIICERQPSTGTYLPPLELDGRDLDVNLLMLNDVVLSNTDYELTNESLRISEVPKEFTLTIETTIKPAANTRLEGLYMSGDIFCTQCEAEGFRRITYFLDRPDIMASYNVTIRAYKNKYPILLSNGNLTSQGELPGNRHYATWNDPFPKPSYLFALVAGDLTAYSSQHKTNSGKEISLHIYTHNDNKARCAYAMDALKRSMSWDEETYGLEYDLELFNIVAINDFNMGAMENKSLNIFNEKYILADPLTATDDDYAAIESIVAHEYFHNWTGNRVTCRDWFQLSLKEGLTVFRDQQFSGHQRSAMVKRIQDVQILRTIQYPEDASPLAHPIRPDSYIEINNFYTATVYEKGAEVIGMCNTILGTSAFRKGMDLYFNRHDGSAVTCEDFLSAMSDANNIDLSQFALWYTQAGTPVIEIEDHWEEESQTYRLKLMQSIPQTPGQDEKQAMHIPLAIGLVSPEGADIPLDLEGSTTKVLNLHDWEEKFYFENIQSRPILSINRGFSAPIKLKHNASPSTLAFLMLNDSDLFNRWDAGQQYATQVLVSISKSVTNGKRLPFDDILIDCIRKTLNDAKLDKSFVTLACTLPSESALIEEMENADPIAIYKARNFLRGAIAQKLKPDLLNVYESNSDTGAYSSDIVATARRGLKNLALNYLAVLPDENIVDKIAFQYRHANNMTDRLAALRALNHKDVDARAAALDDFYRRFRNDPIVIDKWFALQASSPIKTTPEIIKNLIKSPLFSMKQPNKVRALIGTFCVSNPVHFHAVDGSGYEFLGSQILTLDEINPQVAARLATQLGRWKSYNPIRQNLIKKQLKRLLTKENISSDVFEIASKALEQKR